MKLMNDNKISTTPDTRTTGTSKKLEKYPLKASIIVEQAIKSTNISAEHMMFPKTLLLIHKEF